MHPRTAERGIRPGFRLLRRLSGSGRIGELRLAHGAVRTPAFMPIATKGAVKTLFADELRTLRAEILLGNTYHLSLRPGAPLIARAGGLNGFMRWKGPILTDSGGFQVWSLAKLRKVTERGVLFRDGVEGKRHLLTPERAVAIQRQLGSDITMALDDLVGYDASRKKIAEAMERTTRWAVRSKRAFRFSKGRMLFGIVQGGVHKALRQQHADELVRIGFDGYAIGGLAVGEPVHKMLRTLDWVIPHLPNDKPRYLMGVGPPEQIVEAVRRGVDLFDCVLPTRNGRHGLLYIWKGSPKADVFRTKHFYSELRIKQERFKTDLRILDAHCDCPVCRANVSRAYLRHLFLTDDPLAQRLATLHNVRFYVRLMERIREQLS